MIREGSTPNLSTSSISALEAQSKPVPSAARRRRTSGSGLHLTAGRILARLCSHSRPLQRTIVRLHSLQILLPAHMLPIHVAHICHEEGIFFSSKTHIRIHTLHPPFQGILDHCIRGFAAMMASICVPNRTLQAYEVATMNQRFILCGSEGGCWCHNHTGWFSVELIVGIRESC